MAKKISIVGYGDNKILMYNLFSVINKMNKRILFITNKALYKQLDDMNEIIDLGNINIHYTPKFILGLEYGVYVMEDYDFVMIDCDDFLYPGSDIIHISNGNPRTYNYINRKIAEHITLEKRKNIEIKTIEMIYKMKNIYFSKKGTFILNKKESHELYVERIERREVNEIGQETIFKVNEEKEIIEASAKLISFLVNLDEKKVVLFIKSLIEGGI